MIKNNLYIRKINDQTITFMNLVESFSKSSSDMTEVLDKAAYYLDEPLKNILEDFVSEIRLYGDNKQAFKKIYVKLKGCKLLEIFKSFEICDRHEGNFAEIAKEAKKSAIEFDKSIAVRRAIVGSARVDLLSMIGAGMMVLYMLNDFLSKSVFDILLSNYIGIGILVYNIICICIVFLVIAKGE